MPTLFDGTVVYPVGDAPFQGKFSLNWNIKVAPDDPDAPKQESDGNIRIYKTDGTPEADYIRTLQTGDRIKLMWQDTAKTPYYQVLVPAGSPQRPPAQSASQRTVPAPAPSSSPAKDYDPMVVKRLTNDDVESWMLVMENVSTMFKQAVVEVTEKFPTLSEDQKFQLATRFFTSGKIMWRQGSTVEGKKPKPPASQRAEFLSDLGGSLQELEPTVAWATTTAEFFGIEVNAVVSATKDLAINSPEWIGDDDKMWELAMIVNDYATMIDAGSDKSVAQSAIREKYNLAKPAPPDPLF